MQEPLDRIRLKSTILKRYDFTLKALGRCKGGRYSLEQKLTKKGVAMSDFTIEFLKAKLIKKLLPSHPPPNKKNVEVRQDHIFLARQRLNNFDYGGGSGH